VAKNWNSYFGKAAAVKGVTKAELDRVWKKYNELIAAEKGWVMTWKESANSIEVSLATKAEGKAVKE
jgi:hypothetical protein